MLFPRCHYQLIFLKVSFTIFFLLAISGKSGTAQKMKKSLMENFIFCAVWDFSRDNVNAIRQAVNCFDWNRAFNSLNIDKRVKFLTECVLNVFYNFLPNKVITIRCKDTLWMNGP